jgi:hypothetical protein
VQVQLRRFRDRREGALQVAERERGSRNGVLSLALNDRDRREGVLQVAERERGSRNGVLSLALNDRDRREGVLRIAERLSDRRDEDQDGTGDARG